MLAVSNTSPISNRASIGRLDLLRFQFQTLWIPNAVADELARHPDQAALSAIQMAINARWIRIAAPQNPTLLSILLSSLDRGEAEAVLDSTEGSQKSVSKADVQGCIDGCLSNEKFFQPLRAELPRDTSWVRADAVLENVFRELGRLDFRKTTHSVDLTTWLIENDPGQLADIVEMIQAVFGPES
jgi:hypothetical protein